jgi:hypothetical protein
MRLHLTFTHPDTDETLATCSLPAGLSHGLDPQAIYDIESMPAVRQAYRVWANRMNAERGMNWPLDGDTGPLTILQVVNDAALEVDEGEEAAGAWTSDDPRSVFPERQLTGIQWEFRAESTDAPWIVGGPVLATEDSDPADVLTDAAAAEGWELRTEREVLLDFIRQENMTRDFRRYLMDRVYEDRKTAEDIR